MSITRRVNVRSLTLQITIFGIVIIAAACVDMGMIKGFAGMEPTGHETDALLIAIGVLIIIIAAFGCFGAWKESPKLLYIAEAQHYTSDPPTQIVTFAYISKLTQKRNWSWAGLTMFVGCLIIIILLELSVGIAAAALRPQIESTLKSQLRASFIKNKSTKEEDSTYREFWDRVQTSLECCGITGPDNYGASEPRINPSFSCCPNDGTDHSAEIKRSNCLSDGKYYKEGCEDKVLGTIHSAGMTVIVCGILFCFLEVAGIVLALWLAHSIKTQGKSRETA
ncbi:23 kDa integral membrane protein-like [Spodoptera litura]|uniref:Tetraspanin n=1 Tax=Spodoptera litura TaxID=69820 RepID=A0A9J7DVT5_SPOLT|nr:23 kDa integral membrane protein-like [Spodoptera litura]